MTDKPKTVVHKKVIVDVSFGYSPREMKLAMALDEQDNSDPLEALRQELRRRMGV